LRLWRRVRARPGLAAAVLAGVFLLVVGAGWLLRPKDDPQRAVDAGRAVEDFRSAGAEADRPASAGAPVPETGVYTYAAQGYERARALDTARHDYPRRVTLTVRPATCGMTLRLDLLDARWQQWHVCAERSAWTLRTQSELHQFFGRRDEREYRCARGAVFLGFPARDGRPGEEAWTAECNIDDTRLRRDGRILGTEPVEVAGRRIDAVHVRLTERLTGRTEGGGVQELWVDPATGLPLRWTARNDNVTDDIINVPYRERWDLRLASLQPRR
jgi:hypothetical protein